MSLHVRLSAQWGRASGMATCVLDVFACPAKNPPMCSIMGDGQGDQSYFVSKPLPEEAFEGCRTCASSPALGKLQRGTDISAPS